MALIPVDEKKLAKIDTLNKLLRLCEDKKEADFILKELAPRVGEYVRLPDGKKSS